MQGWNLTKCPLRIGGSSILNLLISSMHSENGLLLSPTLFLYYSKTSCLVLRGCRDTWESPKYGLIRASLLRYTQWTAVFLSSRRVVLGPKAWLLLQYLPHMPKLTCRTCAHLKCQRPDLSCMPAVTFWWKKWNITGVMFSNLSYGFLLTLPSRWEPDV